MLRRQQYKAQRVSGDETFLLKQLSTIFPLIFALGCLNFEKQGRTFLLAKFYFGNVSENRVSSNHTKFKKFFLVYVYIAKIKRG